MQTNAKSPLQASDLITQQWQPPPLCAKHSPALISHWNLPPTNSVCVWGGIFGSFQAPAEGPEFPLISPAPSLPHGRPPLHQNQPRFKPFRPHATYHTVDLFSRPARRNGGPRPSTPETSLYRSPIKVPASGQFPAWLHCQSQSSSLRNPPRIDLRRRG